MVYIIAINFTNPINGIILLEIEKDNKRGGFYEGYTDVI